jgi:hypothetical protein
MNKLMIPKQVLAMYDELRTWEAVGNALGVNRGIAFRYAKMGIEPTRKDLRERLGLPEIIVHKQPVKRDPETGRFIPLGEATGAYVNQD